MRMNFFPALTFLSYLFEGFLIIAALDLTLNNGNLILHLGGDAKSGMAALAAEFLAVIMFFIMGHANSTFAHLLFQQCITCFRITRPSYYFLNLIGRHDEDASDFRGQGLRRWFFRLWSLVWKPFGEHEARQIRSWMGHQKLDFRPKENDREIFSQGFWKLFKSDDRQKFDEVIMNFNFSRNMLSAFLIIGVLFFLFGDIQETAERLNLVDCVEPFSAANPGGLNESCRQYEAYNTTMVAVVYGATILLLTLRFFYFFGVITKNVIRVLVEPDKDSDAPSPDQGVPSAS